MVRKLLPCFLAAFVLISPLCLSEEIDLRHEGKCRDFNVTLLAYNFTPGTYDVKVSVTSETESRSAGRIYDPRQGWKSSYYYVDEALEIVNGSGRIKLRIQADITEDITLVGKLRKDQKVWKTEKEEVSQDCPEPKSLSRPVFFLIVMMTIVVLLVGIAYYVKAG